MSVFDAGISNHASAFVAVTIRPSVIARYVGGTAFAEDARVAMGRYVETKLELYGDWRAFTQTNGTIYAVDGSGEQLLKSIDLNNDNWDSL